MLDAEAASLTSRFSPESLRAPDPVAVAVQVMFARSQSPLASQRARVVIDPSASLGSSVRF